MRVRGKINSEKQDHGRNITKLFFSNLVIFLYFHLHPINSLISLISLQSKKFKKKNIRQLSHVCFVTMS